MILDIRIGDVVRLRKPHPCGSNIWQVIRVGADIGLRCQGCQRRVLLPRSILQRRLKGFVNKVERGQGTTSDRPLIPAQEPPPNT